VLSRHNDQGNPAAAREPCFVKAPDPPLGLTALFGHYVVASMWLRLAIAFAFEWNPASRDV
jgi:hypothetical protein